MIRTISGFRQADEGGWVAGLDCLHGQHVRDRSPFQDRSWVAEPATRQAHIGSSIDCPLCDRAEIPDALTMLRTAGPWDEKTLPTALRHSHRTGKSVWAVLKVAEGAVDFRMEISPRLEVRLVAGAQQPIPPKEPHEVGVIGPMCLTVEFWGRSE